jgi:pSer/pThr/pTyr-binding forkhead associated (FHA) protein
VTVPINAATISDPHAEIRYMDQHFYLIDLNSTNGTYLNNATTRLPQYVPILLKSGDIITFDLYKFEFNRAQHGKRGVTPIRQVSGPAAPQPAGQDQGSATALMGAQREAAARQATPVTCTVHPIVHAAGVCTVCQKAYCLICLVHRGQQQVCVQCAKGQSR